MKNTRLFLTSVILVMMCMQAAGQKPQPKFFFSCEVLSIGPEFLTGNTENTLNSGMQINFFPVHVSSYKFPRFYYGAGIYFSQHEFCPTPMEKVIMEQFVIVTTTTSATGTTTTTKPLGDIAITRVGIGLPFGYQTINPEKKISFLVGVIPMFYKFSNTFQDKNYKKSAAGIGGAFQAGVNYQLKKALIRLSYYHGTLPGFNLPLLPGLRDVTGPGSYGSIQFGVVISSFNKSFIQ